MPYTINNALQWPDVIRCRERSITWIPDFQAEASPPAIDGTQQFGSITGGGLWRLTLTAVQVRRPEHVQAWLAFEIQMRGGITPVDVPLFLEGYQPKPVGSFIDIAAVTGWAARDTAGRVIINDADAIKPGQHFADYDSVTYGWRMYRIESVTAVTGSPGQFDLTFWPPARFAVAAAHALEFSRPRQVMRLSDAKSADLDLTLRKRGDPNADFVEAV